MRVFPRRAAKGKGTGGLWQTEMTGEALGAARGGKERPPVEMRRDASSHFEARGPRGPLEAWRCAAVGASGALWNRGDAF